MASVPRDPTPGGPAKWLMDTGSGLDLIGKHDVPAKCRSRHADPVVLHTANGRVSVDTAAVISVPELYEEANPYMLRDSPAVLSIGLRCMEHGYQFVWPPGNTPYFVLPCGQVVPFEVHNNIPYLPTGNTAAKAAPAPQVLRPPSEAPAKTGRRRFWQISRRVVPSPSGQLPAAPGGEDAAPEPAESHKAQSCSRAVWFPLEVVDVRFPPFLYGP